MLAVIYSCSMERASIDVGALPSKPAEQQVRCLLRLAIHAQQGCQPADWPGCQAFHGQRAPPCKRPCL